MLVVPVLFKKTVVPHVVVAQNRNLRAETKCGSVMLPINVPRIRHKQNNHMYCEVMCIKSSAHTVRQM